MTEKSLAERVSLELLPRVRHPAQYIGGELNQLVRAGDWAAADVRVAIAFPDTYAIGMSHLGGQVLYWVCNSRPGVCAERVYCPWIDAEKVMRERRIPLFTWDTRQPVRSADILAISLQYELVYTSLLNLLDLSGVPLLAEERTDGDPLVLVGGPQADNPEPAAAFVDLVVIGDGEEAMGLLVDAVREYRRAGVGRREMVPLLAERFDWVYAPNLYTASYRPDGTLAEVIPNRPGLPRSIRRCHAPDFENAVAPRRPLVAWEPAVHDRIAIEILRGCPHLCRFCHAGHTRRPLRTRSVDKIVEIAEEAYAATGFNEIGLLSLSTSDYPELPELARRLNERFAPRMVNISFPSLRVGEMLRNMPGLGSSVRKAGLTIAVEAAAGDLRRALRKSVSDDDLLAGVRAAYAAGWNHVKLYFMAGFPGERESDIDGIFQLSEAVSQERRKVGKPPAAVTSAVGWLVPKPFTPLQWAAQPPAEYFRQVRERLIWWKRSRRSAVHFRMGWAERSVVEAVLARGDRRVGAAILEAWKRGARFDGWDDCFRWETWQDAFAATGVDPAFYAHRERPIDERLPWDHLGQHLPRAHLERSYADYQHCLTGRAPAVASGLRA